MVLQLETFACLQSMREIFLKELIITNVCVWANWFDLQENQRYQQKADIKTHQSD